MLRSVCAIINDFNCFRLEIMLLEDFSDDQSDAKRRMSLIAEIYPLMTLPRIMITI
jgi:hypothetical protein